MNDRIEKILPLLCGVKSTGQIGKWTAYCPAHEDKSPNLIIKKWPDGSILLHCLSGCQEQDIVSSLRLKLEDLRQVKEQDKTGSNDPAFVVEGKYHGLTKREYIAIQILTGLAADPNTDENSTITAIRWADKLITELNDNDQPKP